MSMFKAIREEAEKVNAINTQVIARSMKEQGRPWALSDEFSGQKSKSRATLSGLGLASGGVLGLIGVGMANAAGAGALGGAASAIGALGTVALGAAVLPAATVAAVGVGVTGLAVLAASQLMKVDYERGIRMSDAARSQNTGELDSLSKQNLSLGAWVKGAKNTLFNMMKSDLGHKAAVQVDSRDVVDLGDQIYADHNVTIGDDAIKAFMDGKPKDGESIGKIVGVDKEKGIVIQHTGRGAGAIHKLSDFKTPPAVGEVMSLKYRGGALQQGPSHQQEQASGLGR